MFSKDAHFKIIPQYLDAAPRPNKIDYERLKDSIKENGQKKPIQVIVDEEDSSLVILDGFTRYQILSKDFKKPDSEISYEIISLTTGANLSPLKYIQLSNLGKNRNEYQMASLLMERDADFWEKAVNSINKFTKRDAKFISFNLKISTRTLYRVSRINEALRKGTLPESFRTELNEGTTSIGCAELAVSILQKFEWNMNPRIQGNEKPEDRDFRLETLRKYAVANLATLSPKTAIKELKAALTNVQTAINNRNNPQTEPTHEDYVSMYAEAMNPMLETAQKLQHDERYPNQTLVLNAKATHEEINEVSNSITSFLQVNKGHMYHVILIDEDSETMKVIMKKRKAKLKEWFQEEVKEEKEKIEKAKQQNIAEARKYKKIAMEQGYSEEDAKKETLEKFSVEVD